MSYKTDLETLQRMIHRRKLSGVVHMLVMICGENHPFLAQFYQYLIGRDE